MLSSKRRAEMVDERAMWVGVDTPLAVAGVDVPFVAGSERSGPRKLMLWMKWEEIHFAEI